MAIKVVDIGAGPHPSGPQYDPCIIGCVAGNWGLFGYKSGSDCVLRGLNVVSGFVNVEVNQTLPLNTWVVIEIRHVGGRLKLRVNNGTFADIAAGNTVVTTDNITFGDSTSGEYSFAQIAFYNAARTEAEIANVATWMGAKVGLTI